MNNEMNNEDTKRPSDAEGNARLREFGGMEDDRLIVQSVQRKIMKLNPDMPGPEAYSAAKNTVAAATELRRVTKEFSLSTITAIHVGNDEIDEYGLYDASTVAIPAMTKAGVVGLACTALASLDADATMQVFYHLLKANPTKVTEFLVGALERAVELRGQTLYDEMTEEPETPSNE